jgi:hypothetical protein
MPQEKRQTAIAHFMQCFGAPQEEEEEIDETEEIEGAN